MKDNSVLKGVCMKGKYCAFPGSWISLERWVLLGIWCPANELVCFSGYLGSSWVTRHVLQARAWTECACLHHRFM